MFKFEKEHFIKWVTLSVSLALHLASLTQPVFCTAYECGETWQGLAMLLTGFLGIITAAGIAWLANPILFYSWKNITYKPKESLIASAVAFLLSLSFLFCKQILANEAGTYHKITGYRLGYWLWLGSSVAMFCGSLSLRIIQTKSKPFNL